MMMKGCHRCGGNIYDEQDLGGTDLVCLQCGYRRMLTAHDVAAVDTERYGPLAPITAAEPHSSLIHPERV